MAWRAFWVGLGASAVLIAQSLSAPTEGGGATPEPRYEVPAPVVGSPTPVELAPPPPARRAAPVLSELPRCTPTALRRC